MNLPFCPDNETHVIVIAWPPSISRTNAGQCASKIVECLEGTLPAAINEHIGEIYFERHQPIAKPRWLDRCKTILLALWNWR